MRRSGQHRPCQPCTATALDGHVRHGVEGSACGRHTTQRIMHTMRLDGTGPLCSACKCASATRPSLTNSLRILKQDRREIVRRASSSSGPPKVYAFTQESRRHNYKHSTPSAYNAQHTTQRTCGKRHAARAPHRAESAGRVAQHTTHNMSQRATPRIQRIAYTTWHACHVARNVMRNMHHKT